MQPMRRLFVLGLAAAALAGCGGGPGRPEPVARRASMQPQPNPDFDAWLQGFRPRALDQGIPAATLDRALASAGFLPDVVARDRNQAEFTRSLEDYLALVASPDRVATGRAMRRRHDATLSAIAARHGVPPEVVTAIWGVESRFGARRGDIPVISATATLAFDGRRGAFFERQLIAALRILASGDATPERMVGSWAGAMGHTQFIPTTYQAYAVDFTGDGRRDIWSEDPADALASAAAYLQRSGWRRGQPWGMELRLPEGFDTAGTGRGRRRPVAAWHAAGVRDAAGRPLPDHGPAAILLPQGPQAPAFAAFHNFDVLLRYNNALNYGIAVGHLSDRIAGAGPLRTPFPPDAQGLTQADRRELQCRLTAAGFDTGGVDGVIGANTEAAIRAWEARAGLPETGTASPALLARLRG